MNRAVNAFIRLLFGHGYNDTTNAFKAYRREVIETVQPLVSNHFNLTVELPLKAVVRGNSYAIVPISWTNRTSGESKLRLQEMGSRYLFIVLMVLLEHRLSRGDYRRTPGARRASRLARRQARRRSRRGPVSDADVVRAPAAASCSRSGELVFGCPGALARDARELLLRRRLPGSRDRADPELRHRLPRQAYFDHFSPGKARARQGRARPRHPELAAGAGRADQRLRGRVAAYWLFARQVMSIRAALVTSGLVAAGVVFVRIAQWWAAGAQQIPYLTLSLVFLAAATHWCRTRRTWALAVALLALAGIARVLREGGAARRRVRGRLVPRGPGVRAAPPGAGAPRAGRPRAVGSRGPAADRVGDHHRDRPVPDQREPRQPRAVERVPAHRVEPRHDADDPRAVDSLRHGHARGGVRLGQPGAAAGHRARDQPDPPPGPARLARLPGPVDRVRGGDRQRAPRDARPEHRLRPALQHRVRLPAAAGARPGVLGARAELAPGRRRAASPGPARGGRSRQSPPSSSCSRPRTATATWRTPGRGPARTYLDPGVRRTWPGCAPAGSIRCTRRTRRRPARSIPGSSRR